MSAAATPERLVPQLEAWLSRGGRASVYAVHHEGAWDGGDALVVAGREVDVRICPSELAVREALAGRSGDGRPLVILTPVTDLGDDVLARLSRQRVARVHAGDAVRHLFGDVRGLDSRLISQRWLLEALVDSAPPGGYERAGALQLDLDRAWAALLRHRYGVELGEGLAGLIRWAADGGGAQLAAAPEVERDAIVERLSDTVAGAAPLLTLVLAGRATAAQGFGLVARVLADAPDGAPRAAAMIRAELLLAGVEPSRAQLRALAGEAEDLTRAGLAARDARATEALRAAEQILTELQAGELAAHSSLLHSGLRRREAILGALLAAHATVADVEAAAQAVSEHYHAAEHGAGERAELALRLYRWLATEEELPPDLRAAALRHATDGAYADRARLALRAGGADAELDAALRRLVASADERRLREERHFATLIGQWAANAETSDELLGVEDVLARIAAPIAARRPILFVLLDGMSHRVGGELLESLSRVGWTELRREAQPDRALAVSTLPSLTTFSRATLFEGTLTRGTATDEAKAFAVHPELAAAGGGAPKLLHKGALPDEHSGLAAELREEIAGSRRVVGVVVNAIDDHLARSEQLSTTWSARDIAPLPPLLDAARDAGRIVVLASDHGHVIEHGSKLHSSGGSGGERWRVADAAGEGEVLVEGPRVLAPGGRCVMAWDERVRYSPKKNGYHGGASAQEVLTPVLVLAPDLSEAVEGWTEAPLDLPAWWVGVRGSAPVTAVEAPPEPAAEPGQQMTLESPARPAAAWIPRLLASETLAAQRAAAGRSPLSDERVATVLGALDANGGRLLRDALARACGIAPLRLTGTLAALRQLLNVDGYAVLEVDEATGDVLLDRELLVRQFGLEN